MFFQVNVEDEFLDLHMYQRSADIFLGVPFNIASYGLLLEMIAHVTHRKPRHLFTSYGDIHLYVNHLEQAEIQIGRDCKPLPILTLNPLVENIFDFVYSDIKFGNYVSHPILSGEIAI